MNSDHTFNKDHLKKKKNKGRRGTEERKEGGTWKGC